jgi:hypothetical protein
MEEADVVSMRAAPSLREAAHLTASLMAEESAVSMRAAPSLCKEESPHVLLMGGDSVILFCALRDYRRGYGITLLTVDMLLVGVKNNCANSLS